MKLKRELGLFSTTLYGIGVILGAGIYALIAMGASLAGNMLWLAFLVSAVIAIFTGLSYAELAGRFPKEAAEYNYTRKAFGSELFSFSIGWVLAIGTVIAASTVALGFGGYFSSLFGVEPRIAAAGLVFVMAVLNYTGIRESANFNNFSTLLEVFGLFLVVAIGFLFPAPVNVDLFELPASGTGGILAAVSVIFFAYIGFENVANLSEEVKDSKKTVPRALVLSLVISTILYMLVAVAAVKEIGWDELSKSNAPLTLVVSRALGEYAVILSLIALFATANTVLIFLIISSRILYGMAYANSLPRLFSHVGSRGTPTYSVLATGVLAFSASYFISIKTVAQLTDLSVFLAYLAVNASLIAVSSRSTGSSFRSPRVCGVPVFAWLGALATFFMLFAFELKLWLAVLAVLAAGLLLFLFVKRRPAGHT